MSKKPKADLLQQKSPAEFFAENKNIAGFDNPGKCLYTTIRELAENALDSAESIRCLPDIEITIDELSRAGLNRIRGVEQHERLDEELYHDFETQEAKKKRLAKQVKDQERQEKLVAKKGEAAAALDAKKRADPAGKKDATVRGHLFYRVTVKDNGSGMPHKDIPNMLGRVLSGTKYGVKQTRGKFGLGAKMALIWSKMTTGLPFEITSAMQGQGFVSQYTLDIDIHRNEPNVHREAQLPNPDGWHGAQLSLIIEGNWQYYRPKILKYLRQIAVITPYSQFTFVYNAEDEKHSLRVVFRRRTDVMPPAPAATKHHPSSVDLELIKRLVASTPCGTMVQFLSKEFDCINKALAGRLVEEMRAGVGPDTSPKALTDKQVVRLHQLLHEVKFDDPRGSHLSPAGEYNLRLGVMKELRPDMVATYQGDVRVFEGHAFIVEAAVSLGGKDLKGGINVYRFANRIPLLFEGGSDVITKTALKRINWGSYKINQTTDKVGVFVSIVSTKIPFKGAGKEYIGDDVEEMVGAVKQAIQQCCVQLKTKITRALAAREQKQRKRNLLKYIPNTCAAIWSVLEAMSGNAAQPGPKKARLEEQHALMARLRRKELDRAQLEAKLTEHVERIDTDLVLEYQVQLGMAGSSKTDLQLVPRTDRHVYGADLHSNTAIITLLQPLR